MPESTKSENLKKKAQEKGWNQKESKLKFKHNIIGTNVEVKVSNKKKGKYSKCKKSLCVYPFVVHHFSVSLTSSSEVNS
jgi:hypothetical protein